MGATPCFNIPGFLRSDDYGSLNGNNAATVPCCCFGTFDDIQEDNTNTDLSALFPTKEPDDPLFIKMVIDSVVESFLKNGTDETETETDTAINNPTSSSNSNSDTATTTT